MGSRRGNGAALDDARHNLEDSGRLIEWDLSESVPDFKHELFDVILLPSINYYIPQHAFVELLRACGKIIVDKGIFYIRSRLPDDWRFGRGTPEGHNTFRLNCRETGEEDLLNVFYSADELVRMLREQFGDLDGLVQLFVRYENLQRGTVIGNADVVIWGKTTNGRSFISS